MKETRSNAPFAEAVQPATNSKPNRGNRRIWALTGVTAVVGVVYLGWAIAQGAQDGGKVEPVQSLPEAQIGIGDAPPHVVRGLGSRPKVKISRSATPSASGPVPSELPLAVKDHADAPVVVVESENAVVPSKPVELTFDNRGGGWPQIWARSAPRLVDGNQVGVYYDTDGRDRYRAECQTEGDAARLAQDERELGADESAIIWYRFTDGDVQKYVNSVYANVDGQLSSC